MDELGCVCDVRQLQKDRSWKQLGIVVTITTEKGVASGCNYENKGEVTVNACVPMKLQVDTLPIDPAKGEFAAIADKLPYHTTTTHPLGELTIGQYTRMAKVSSAKGERLADIEIVKNSQVAVLLRAKGLLSAEEYAKLGYDLNGLETRIKIESRKYLDYVGRANNQTDTELLCLLGDDRAEDARCSGTPLTKSDNGNSDWTGNVKPWVKASIKNKHFITLINSKQPSPNRIKDEDNQEDRYIDMVLDENLEGLLGMSKSQLVQLLTTHQTVPGERDLRFVIADDDFLKSATLDITIPCLTQTGATAQ
jgi:hypothetical protein